MATVIKTITETSGTAPTMATWTFSYTHADVVVSGPTFTFGPPTMTAKYVNSARSYAEVTSNLFLDSTFPKSRPYDYYTCSQDAIAWASNVTKAIPLTYSEQNTYNTSDFFTSSNASSKEVPIHIIDRSTWGESRQADMLYGEFNFGFGDKDWGTLFNVVLNVPPTATLGTPTYATPQYAGLGAYTVPITSAEAYYGGNIAKVTLKVGQDSTVKTYSSATISDETISVIPTIAGKYTPTITVEDSRGQTYTETLPQITVNPYLAPSLDFDVFRSNSSGVKDDEGEYGLITANVSFTDAIADLTTPTVKINGVTTSDVTWYSTYSASVGVLTPISNWSTISSGDTIYGLVDGSFEQEDSYTVSVTLTDSFGESSAEITQTLSTAFYTIDFQAGGKEIAFGGPANDTLTTNQEDVGLFKCNMESQFNEDAVFNSDLTAQDMTAQEVQDFVDGLNIRSHGILDVFYPVGSYYETSDSTFDPNISWGGTWSSKSSFDNGIVLFNNDAQSLSGAITLSDSAVNYDRLDILFRTNDNFFDSTTVYAPNNKNAILWTAGITATSGNHGRVYVKIKVAEITGTTINTKYNNVSGTYYYYTAEKDTAVTGVGTVGDYIGITQVIGYKTIYCWHRTA